MRGRSRCRRRTAGPRTGTPARWSRPRSSSWATAMTSATSSPPHGRLGDAVDPPDLGAGRARPAGAPSGPTRRSCRRGRRRRGAATVVSTSSRESIVSDRYGWVWKKSKDVDRRERGDDAGGATAEGGDGDDDDHQDEGGVGRVEDRPGERQHGADDDRRRDPHDDADREAGAQLGVGHRRPPPGLVDAHATSEPPPEAAGRPLHGSLTAATRTCRALHQPTGAAISATRPPGAATRCRPGR